MNTKEILMAQEFGKLLTTVANVEEIMSSKTPKQFVERTSKSENKEIIESAEEILNEIGTADCIFREFMMYLKFNLKK